MTRKVVGIDVFCGAGGLTYGLRRAGISMVAGVDLDPACEFPFEHNNDGATFIQSDIRKLTVGRLNNLYPKNCIRLLAGCAPCRPFSSYRRGESKTTSDKEWSLVSEFARLVKGLKPHLVTMENVAGLASKPVFARFVKSLEDQGFEVDYRSVYCPKFGIPQQRRRLVLVASRIGTPTVPVGQLKQSQFRTVRQAIGGLKPLASGSKDSRDRIHRTRELTEINLERLRVSAAGGTWRDWPEHLRVACHKKATGASYQSVYGRMRWDLPSPTITTQFFNVGTGRFGHPDQLRGLSLREAAILQTFPRTYRFVRPRGVVYFSKLGQLIGNAVPPQLARHVGSELMRVANAYDAKRSTKR